MKLIFTVLLFLVLILNANATIAEVGGPIDMPNIWMLIQGAKLSCGEIYVQGGGSGADYWLRFFLGRSNNPFLIIHERESIKKDFFEAWIDNEQDGKFDEKFTDPNEFEKKLPTLASICEIVKK